MCQRTEVPVIRRLLTIGPSTQAPLVSHCHSLRLRPQVVQLLRLHRAIDRIHRPQTIELITYSAPQRVCAAVGIPPSWTEVCGLQTTAHTLCFALGLLALHQDEQQRLFKHIESVIPEGKTPVRSMRVSLRCLNKAFSDI